MSLRCFFRRCALTSRGQRTTAAPPPLAELLQDNGANLAACWCYLTAAIKPPAVVRWAKHLIRTKNSQTLDCQAPLMNACIHNAEGREINERLIWRWSATAPDCVTVKGGCSRRCRTGQTSQPLPFRSIFRKQKAIGSWNLFRSEPVT